MATARKKINTTTGYLRRSTFLDLNQQPTNHNSDDYPPLFEFDESEVWNHFASSDQSQPATGNKKSIPISSRPSKKMVGSKSINKMVGPSVVSSSLPLNVPDWSKILGAESKKDYDRYDDDNDRGQSEEDGEDEDKFPPHVYLARTRGASLSVHEGIGRTLKGRDLRRVRNAIWKRTGFED